MAENSAASALAQRVSEIIVEHEGLEGPLLPILHAIQAEFGHVPDAALPQIARALNISRADIHGVTISGSTPQVGTWLKSAAPRHVRRREAMQLRKPRFHGSG